MFAEIRVVTSCRAELWAKCFGRTSACAKLWPISSPEMCCRSAKQVGLQITSEHRREESCGSQSSWSTVPDDSACDHKTPHP